jgi:hypothetical protein
MLTAYTTALPPSALPAAIGSVTVVSARVLFAVLIAALAVVTGAIVERAFATPRRRPVFRPVDATSTGAGSRHAA